MTPDKRRTLLIAFGWSLAAVLLVWGFIDGKQWLAFVGMFKVV